MPKGRSVGHTCTTLLRRLLSNHSSVEAEQPQSRLCECCLCDALCFLCSLSQDSKHVFRFASINRAPLSDRCKQPLQYGFEPPLYRHVAETSTTITRFQLSDVCRVLVECIEIG